MAHTIEQRGDYATIYRKSDGGRSFSGNAATMRSLLRRLNASSAEISSLVERRMQTHNKGAPWHKYKEWLKERGNKVELERVKNILTNEELNRELVDLAVT